MNHTLELLFFVSAILGFLISCSMLIQVFNQQKAHFFMGLVVLVFSFQLLFSWGGQSGYNNTNPSLPLWIFLNYLILPPALWLFVKFQIDDNFRWRPWHYLLFLPALLETILQILFINGVVPLNDYPETVWFSEHLALAGFLFALGFFWVSFIRLNGQSFFTPEKKVWLTHVRLLILMLSLSIIGLLWLVFSFIGWQHFHIIEMIMVVLFFGLAFLNFLENQAFPSLKKAAKVSEFPNYNDKEQLGRLNQLLQEQKLYLKPNLPLKELAAQLALPNRYVSYLINRYHGKNYKEFINEFRIGAFIEKAQSGKENHKTLLALALESGFSSKSTFNYVFKNHVGKSPSEYLKY